MSESSSKNGPLLVLVGAVWLMSAFQLYWTHESRARLDRMEQQLATLTGDDGGAAEQVVRLEKAAIELREQLDSIEGLRTMAEEWDFVVDGQLKTERNVADIKVFLEETMGTDMDAVEQPPELDWTQPELFAAAAESGAEYGIELTKDEVRVRAELLLRAGLLEYLAVLNGGKEHEALIALVGDVDPEEPRPRDFGARLNNAIQALGLKRGRPLRITRFGSEPPEGQNVYLYLEWETGGERQVVRASDLVWNRVVGAPMGHDEWVYVGSSWVPGRNPGEVEFAADLTAEFAATYSAVNTIIDNTSEGAVDDTVFIVATPRVPEDVKFVTLIVRAEPLEDVHEFAPPPSDFGTEEYQEPDGEPPGPR